MFPNSDNKSEEEKQEKQESSQKIESEFPSIPKDDPRFSDLQTSEMFNVLIKRIQNEKAVHVLKKGHAVFLELKENTTHHRP